MMLAAMLVSIVPVAAGVQPGCPAPDAIQCVCPAFSVNCFCGANNSEGIGFSGISNINAEGIAFVGADLGPFRNASFFDCTYGKLGEVIVMDAEKCWRSEADIFRNHRITSRASLDLH